jgi:hypothetical protein
MGTSQNKTLLTYNNSVDKYHTKNYFFLEIKVQQDFLVMGPDLSLKVQQELQGKSDQKKFKFCYKTTHLINVLYKIALNFFSLSVKYSHNGISIYFFSF